MSWRTKLALTYCLVIVLLVGTAGFFLERSVSRQYLEGAKLSLLTQASIAATVVGQELDQGRSLDSAVDSFSQQIGHRLLAIDSHGKVLSDSAGPNGLVGEVLGHAEVTSALRGQGVAETHFLGGEGWVMYATSPISRGRETVGAVLISASLEQIMRQIASFRQSLLTILALSGVLVAVISLVVASFITRPIKELTLAAKGLSQGDLSRRADLRQGKDEIAQLGAAFNTMADALEDWETARRSFIANASHELRTPLGSIKALTQSALDDPEADPGLYREFLKDIEDEVDRLARLVNNLLEMTRLSRVKGLDLSMVNLQELVAEGAHLLQPLAESKGVSLTVSASPAVYVMGDGERLLEIVLNLIDNGIKYTPSGGQVTISLLPGEQWVEIRVQDTGVGIAPEALPHLFEPFYRGDSARTRDRGRGGSEGSQGGFGLGLALSQEIAHLHGGSITVESQLGKGSTFTVRFPAQAESLSWQTG